MRIGRAFFIIAILLCAFELVRLWGLMPDSMAAHFNVLGDPDRFAPKAESFTVQIQVLLAVIMAGLTISLSFLVIPSGIVNMPNRDYWLAPDRRAESMARLSDFGFMMFGIILLTIQAGFEIAAYANLRVPIWFNAQLMGVVTAFAVVLIVILLLRLLYSFQRPSSAEGDDYD